MSEAPFLARLASPVSYKTHGELTSEHLRRPLYPLVHACVSRLHAPVSPRNVERRMRCIAAFHARPIQAIITDIKERITLFLQLYSEKSKSDFFSKCLAGKDFEIFPELASSHIKKFLEILFIKGFYFYKKGERGRREIS